MGQVVQFRKRPFSVRRERAVRGEAEILIFTGVRYDRGKKPNEQGPHGARRTGRKGI